jgi:RHS repeat-associated protein
VDDSKGDGLYPDDFDDQDADNYTYDESGNLISDDQAGTEIEWTPYGKVSSVERTNENQKIIFGYDPAQNRVMKATIDQTTSDTIFTYYMRDAQGNVMGIYQRQEDTITWQEQHLYGSSRLGIIAPQVSWYVGDSHVDSAYYVTHPILSEGCKQYELTDHLGNVRSVLSDRRAGIDSTGNSEADYFEAVVVAANDYYPFGQRMPGRTYQSGDYRYGFNGKEKDEEGEWGDLTHYDYGFRIYNPAIGRFLRVDPLAADYAAWSPYNYVMGNPIRNIDPDGRSVEDDFRLNKDGSLTLLRKTGSSTHTIYNFDESASIEINKSVIDDWSSRKVRTQEDGIVTSASSGTISDPEKAREFFKFFADNSDSEFGLTLFHFGQSQKAVGVLSTSYEERFNVGQLDFELMLLSSHSDAIISETWHNHPKSLGPDQPPSGFFSDGTPLPYNFGDRGFFIDLNKDYKGRVPESFNLYIPEGSQHYIYDDKEYFKLSSSPF